MLLVLFSLIQGEKEMKENGTGADLAAIKPVFKSFTNEIMAESGITVPSSEWSHSGGKKGTHSEHLGFILAQLQYMQRAYPNMTW